MKLTTYKMLEQQEMKKEEEKNKVGESLDDNINSRHED